MRALRNLPVTAILGAQLSWVSTGGAQTVEPSQAPPPPASQTKPKARKPDKATLEEAKHAYSAGEMAYKAGDYKTAIQNFQDAQALLPSPHATYWLALSLKADGLVPEALAELKTLLASSSADRLGSEKLATARAALDDLGKTPGMVKLSTDPAGASVSVDGEVSPGVSPLAVKLAPGAHTLTVSLPGHESMALELEVPPGSKGEQTLSLTALPPPPAPAAGAPQVPASQTQRLVVQTTGPVPVKPSNVGRYVVFSCAGASAIVGTIFGIRALRNKSEFESKPSNSVADNVDRNAIIADVGFGAAITLGLTGLVMVTVREDLPAPRDKARTEGTSARPAFAFSPYAGRSGAGASAMWRF
jgi:PEGA domain